MRAHWAMPAPQSRVRFRCRIRHPAFPRTVRPPSPKIAYPRFLSQATIIQGSLVFLSESPTNHLPCIAQNGLISLIIYPTWTCTTLRISVCPKHTCQPLNQFDVSAISLVNCTDGSMIIHHLRIPAPRASSSMCSTNSWIV